MLLEANALKQNVLTNWSANREKGNRLILSEQGAVLF